MADTGEPDQHRPNRWKRVGQIVSLGWGAFLAYLLLAADPPDFWFEDVGAVDGLGHVVGGGVTGLVAYLLLARRKLALLFAVGVAVTFLLGLELVQDRFTSRGYEISDVTLSIVGVVIGVGTGWAALMVARRSREG